MYSSSLLFSTFGLVLASSPLPRNVRISGQHFVLSATNESIVLGGPNIVVKGPPYLPGVSGTTHCQVKLFVLSINTFVNYIRSLIRRLTTRTKQQQDIVDSECSAAGNCTTCFTFNEADVALIKSQVRLHAHCERQKTSSLFSGTEFHSPWCRVGWRSAS